MTSLYKKLSIFIKIGVIKRYGVCLVSFKIVDRIRRQSSSASCECSHRRRRRDKTVSSRRRCVLGFIGFEFHTADLHALFIATNWSCFLMHVRQFLCFSWVVSINEPIRSTCRPTFVACSVQLIFSHCLQIHISNASSLFMSPLRRHIFVCFMAKSAFFGGFSALAPYTGVGPI